MNPLSFFCVTLALVLFAYISKIIYSKFFEPTQDKALATFDQIKRQKAEAQSYFLKATEKYFTGSHKDIFVNKYNSISELFDSIDRRKFLKFLSEEEVNEVREWISNYKDIDTIRKKHNDDFVKNELERNKDFFDNVMKYPLDAQQRESILRLEDAALVISAAGGGKSTTMVGKVKYLVERCGVDPKNILIITYTRKAARELTEKLHDDRFKCKTFHRTAMDIVSEVEEAKPSIIEPSFLLSLLERKINSSSDFKSAIVRYFSIYQNLTRFLLEYQDSKAFFADRNKYGKMSPYRDMDGGVVFTKSEEERRITIFLHEQGVKFRYEQPYEFDVSDSNHSQMKPDFSLFFTDNDGQEKRVYLEHFAIDRQGNVPKWFRGGRRNNWEDANAEYKRAMAWKKETHRRNNTKLIFTTSAMFADGSWETELRRILEDAGVPLKAIPVDELYRDLTSVNSSLINVQLLKLAESFINLLKCNMLNGGDVLTKAQQNNDLRSVDILNNLLIPLLQEYDIRMKEDGKVDFNDLILKATDYCKTGRYKSPYEYILVDEFQDISLDRCEFIKSLRQDEPLTQLFCVGDDWQSIYRFGGSDLHYINYFSEIFGHTEECHIETTYRFGNPLLEQSSTFIQKNSAQKRKTVRSHNRKLQTNLQFVETSDAEGTPQKLYDIVKEIPKEDTVLIIGRYGFNVKSALDNKFITARRRDSEDDPLYLCFHFDGNTTRDVEYMTVHKAKGLEADHVILIDCDSGRTGFPSLVADDPVLSYLLSESDDYEFGEERRVFYVAITRSIKNMYVFSSQNRQSPFVTEMLLADKPNICPYCGIGHLIQVRQGTATNGNRYTTYKCSNKDCGHRENQFQNEWSSFDDGMDFDALFNIH